MWLLPLALLFSLGLTETPLSLLEEEDAEADFLPMARRRGDRRSLTVAIPDEELVAPGVRRRGWFKKATKNVFKATKNVKKATRKVFKKATGKVLKKVHVKKAVKFTKKHGGNVAKFTNKHGGNVAKFTKKHGGNFAKFTTKEYPKYVTYVKELPRNLQNLKWDKLYSNPWHSSGTWGRRRLMADDVDESDDDSFSLDDESDDDSFSMDDSSSSSDRRRLIDVEISDDDSFSLDDDSSDDSYDD